MKTIAILLLTVMMSACASSTAMPPAQPSEDPDDFNIRATLIATYNVISGPAGRRDWNRMRDLFAPGARLIARRKDGTFNVMTPDEYIEHATPLMNENGFFERPVVNRIERYGDIAHVFSTYETRHAANDEKPFARGINSFQLVRIGDQWKVQTILWQQEDETHVIPPQYLAK